MKNDENFILLQKKTEIGRDGFLWAEYYTISEGIYSIQRFVISSHASVTNLLSGLGGIRKGVGH
jgi:hypothetical protein